MKIQTVPVLLILAVSLRKACDISRACNPIFDSPISPSISAFGVSAATESITTISMALERIRWSAISSACSPLSGCEISRSSISTPSFCAYVLSKACSASINAAIPPAFWASAIAWIASVVLPDDSGPKISIIRPFGYPPIPSAWSIVTDPDGMTGTLSTARSLIFMMAPFPKSFSILSITALNTLSFSGFT